MCPEPTQSSVPSPWVDIGTSPRSRTTRYAKQARPTNHRRGPCLARITTDGATPRPMPSSTVTKSWVAKATGYPSGKISWSRQRLSRRPALSPRGRHTYLLRAQPISRVVSTHTYRNAVNVARAWHAQSPFRRMSSRFMDCMAARGLRRGWHILGHHRGTLPRKRSTA